MCNEGHVMSEPRTPDELTINNELICTKLLGWQWQPRFGNNPCGLFFPDGRVANGPYAFTTWDEAGLILEALDDEGVAWIFSNGPEGDYECRICPHATRDQVSYGETGPLAIRAAALTYIRSKS